MFFGTLNRRRLGPSSARVYDDVVAELAPTHRWKLDEAAGTTASDSVGSIHGTYAGTYTLADRTIVLGANKAVRINSGRVGFSPGTALDLVNGVALTHILWLRLRSYNGSFPALLWRQQVNASLGYTNMTLQLAPSGGAYYLQFGWTDAGTNVYSGVQSPSSLSLDTDYLVAARYDGTNRSIVVNGSQVVTGNGAVNSPASAQGTFVGEDGLFPGSDDLDANVYDEMRFDYALTDAQLLRLYNLGHI